jgi:hypothetical protein
MIWGTNSVTRVSTSAGRTPYAAGERGLRLLWFSDQTVHVFQELILELASVVAENVEVLHVVELLALCGDGVW